MNPHLLLSLFHIFAVVPLFLYVALSRSNTANFMYSVFLYLGVFIALYHSYKLFLKYKAGSSGWVNLIHILFIAPLLVFIGYNNKETPRYAYEILAMTAFAALGYHIYYVIQEINMIQDTAH